VTVGDLLVVVYVALVIVYVARHWPARDDDESDDEEPFQRSGPPAGHAA
jgi:hypothetical protein